MAEPTHHGGCLCGAVRIAVSADPLLTRLCWCRLCQSLAAGNATVNVVFPSDKVTVEGEAPAWAHIDANLPQFPRQPPPVI